MKQCDAIGSPNSFWSFCPNVVANYLFVGLFGLAMLAHIAQAIHYRTWSCWVIVMSALWQFGAYLSRGVSILEPASKWVYMCWSVLLMTAPLWTNAFVYLLLGRMVADLTGSAQLFSVPVKHLSALFILLDIITFAVQSFGIYLAIQTDAAKSSIIRGIHVYMAGIGIQQLFVVLFAVVLRHVHGHLKLALDSARYATVRRLIFILYAALALITLRIIFRLVEYSKGLQSAIPRQEAYQYCLDSSPMLVALLLFNIVHPGSVLGDEGKPVLRKWRAKDVEEVEVFKALQVQLGRIEEMVLSRDMGDMMKR